MIFDGVVMFSRRLRLLYAAQTESEPMTFRIQTYDLERHCITDINDFTRMADVCFGQF